MNADSDIELSPRMRAAIDEIEQIVLQHFPEATFDVGEGEDPDGIHLIATVDLEDLGEVRDLYRDRLVDMQVEEQLPLYVISTRPVARALEMMRKEQERTPWKRRA